MRINNRATGSSIAIPVEQIQSGETAAVSSDKLRQLYTTMSELRGIRDQDSTRTQKKSHDIALNEACEVGCTIDLRSEDIIVPLPHRIAAQAKAIQAPTLESSIENTLCIDTAATWWNILGAQASSSRLSLATGAAFAYKTPRRDAVVVVFSLWDEVARSKDALYFALDHCLPIIYMQLPNAKSRKSSRWNSSRVDPMFTTIPVDRSDVVAVYRVASEAIDRARRGVGPTLIQCIDWPLSSRRSQSHDLHCRDPIAYMESYLRSKNLWSPELKHNRLRTGPLTQLPE